MPSRRTSVAISLCALVCRASIAAENLPGAANPNALAAEGAKAYREGRIAEARSLFESALGQQARLRPALAGLGLIHHIEHRPRQAQQALALAYQLDPNDPKVVRDYALAAAGTSVETVLLERLLKLPRTSLKDLEHSAGHLEMHRRLAGRQLNQLVSEYRPYRLRMPLAMAGDWHAHGWTLRVRINGGRPLRLLLDTGARTVLIFKNKAAQLGLETLTDSSIGGFGGEARRNAKSMLASAFVVEDQLELANVIVDVADRPLIDGLDGLIPTDLFRHFLITCNGPKRQLELTPFEGHDPLQGAGERPWANLDPPPPLAEGFEPLRRLDHLLVMEDRGSQFIVDTGAGYTVIHQPATNMNVAAPVVGLVGISGTTDATRTEQPVLINLAGQKSWTREVVATDLEPISEYFGVHIAGFLGFPVLRDLELTLDARNNSIRIRRGGK